MPYSSVGLQARLMAVGASPVSQIDGMLSDVEEVTRRVVSALDEQYNVCDLAKFVSCVDILERLSTPNLNITTNVLLTTNIGRTINEVRKKLPAKDAHLARRLKQLIKVWRSAVSDLPAVLPPKPPEPPDGEPVIKAPVKPVTPISTVPSAPVSPAVKLNGDTVYRSSPVIQNKSTASPVVLPPPTPTETVLPPPATPKLTLTLRTSKRPVSESVEDVREPVGKRARITSSSVPIPSVAARDRNSRLPSPLNSSTPDAINKRPKVREKVLTHQELVNGFLHENPDAVTDPDKFRFPDVIPDCDVVDNQAVIAGGAKETGKVEAGPSRSGVDPRRDPVEDELADILKNLPPLDPDARVSWEEDERNEDEKSSRPLTEAFVDKTVTGEQMTVLPYIYFPFPRS